MHPSITEFEAEMRLLKQQFPNAQVPPNCSLTMKAENREYESRTMLKIAFPVLKESLNPMMAMQGGFIAAAFDNTFGPLSYLAAKKLCITLDLHTNFIRSILPGDELIVTARVVSRGLTTMALSGEAVNKKGKLIATSTSQMMIMK